jgi:hypothetical protein
MSPIRRGALQPTRSFEPLQDFTQAFVLDHERVVSPGSAEDQVRSQQFEHRVVPAAALRVADLGNNRPAGSGHPRPASSHARFLPGRGTGQLRLKNFQVELLVELRNFVGHAVGQQFGTHGHEQAVVAGTVVDQGVAEFGGHE